MVKTSEKNLIQDICIVENLTNVPPDYEAIARTSDTNEAADIYKDNFFSKVPRFLCTTSLTKPGVNSMVVVDIAIVQDKTHVPNGFTCIEYTRDSAARALRKKVLCVKFENISSTNSAICEIILVSKQKNAPCGFNFVGELDGICMFQRFGPVVQQPIAHISRDSSARPAYAAPTPPAVAEAATMLRYIAQSAVSGVPFQLNSHLETIGRGGQRNEFQLPPIICKTRHDLDSEYEYTFSVEHAVLAN